MPVRDVIEIDEELCDGCGECVTACAEGAIALVDGKAKLISDVYCDGLGACIGDCPQGAITVIQREADEFDEGAVREHLARQAAAGLSTSMSSPTAAAGPSAGELPMVGGPAPAASCPGSRTRSWAADSAPPESAEELPSRLRQWPIQLHLVPPTAPFFHDADVLLAADCVAFSVGGFHSRFLDGRGLAIACPKLDSHQEIYVQKLASMIDDARIRSIDVMVMEVPCCSGLVQLVRQATVLASREVPVRCRVVGVQGNILAEQPL
jgi:NAD-dependent dihydropyrimidine dehydrogenase PreA subunit